MTLDVWASAWVKDGAGRKGAQPRSVLVGCHDEDSSSLPFQSNLKALGSDTCQIRVLSTSGRKRPCTAADRGQFDSAASSWGPPHSEPFWVTGIIRVMSRKATSECSLLLLSPMGGRGSLKGRGASQAPSFPFKATLWCSQRHWKTSKPEF